jgi:hypothetical protein
MPFILAPIMILILVPGVMVGIRLARPRFAYFWLVAAAGVLVAWPLVLLARPSQPLAIPLAT